MRDRDNRYTEEVMLSFLIVGHAHEDIDQLFSVLSRYLKKVGKVMGPSEFQSELQNAMHASLRTAHFELLEAVIDWDAYLRPHLVATRHPLASSMPTSANTQGGVVR